MGSDSGGNIGEEELLLREPLENVLLSFLDVETTGLDPWADHRICEVGISRVRGWKEVDSFSTLVNPQRHIPLDATAVNRITDSMVRDAPKFPEIAGDVLEMIAGTVVVCHNVPFDMGFLEKEMKMIGISLPFLYTVDTLEIAKNWFEFPSNSLDFLARAFGISSPRHRGIEDARTTCQLLRRMLLAISMRGFEVRTIGDLILVQGGIQNEDLGRAKNTMASMWVGKKVRISYISGTGEISRRVIYPKEIQGQYIVAFCTLRGEERTFRISRIVEAEIVDKEDSN